jgi:hypothetical protein
MRPPLRTIITQPAALADLVAAYGGDAELADKAFLGPSFVLARDPSAGTKTYHNSRIYAVGMHPKGIWIGAFVYYEFDEVKVTIHRIRFVENRPT